MNRQWLQKILHSSRVLSLMHRVRLYLTCVRASAVYGLCAAGLTIDVLYRLGVFEVRHIRAIAESPVHLTRETTESLYARLKISTPQQHFRQLVERRVVVADHAVNGMPKCRHCSRIFPSFVVFKKHILNACPVLLASPAPPEASIPGEEQTLLGRSCRESDSQPMMNVLASCSLSLTTRGGSCCKIVNGAYRSKTGAFGVDSGSLTCGCPTRKRRIGGL